MVLQLGAEKGTFSAKLEFKARSIMVTGGDVVERLEKRAVEAEETIAMLKTQLLFLQKAAGW